MSQKNSLDHIVVGAGLAGLMTYEKLSGTKLILEATDVLGGRFSSGLHVMQKSELKNSSLLNRTKDLEPIKIRWDREWVEPAMVDWKDPSWGGVYLSTWSHYFAGGLCAVSFSISEQAKQSWQVSLGEPVVELGVGEGEGAWLIKTPKDTYCAKNIHWCAGLTAFQNAVGKHASQKFLGENEVPTDTDKEFRGGFAIQWTIPTLAFQEKTELCPEVQSGGLFAIPVKHGGVYCLMIFHLEVSSSAIDIQTLTYVHEDILKDPKESLSLQKSLKRALKMLFVDQNAIDLQTSSERMVVDQRLLGASRGLIWLLKPQPELGLFFAGEEALGAESVNMGLFRAMESAL